MSRHRIVRAMDYSEECDGFDDVYGHSVEDDHCISPSDAAEFMFDRTRQHQMSAFFNEENDCHVRSSKHDRSVGDQENQKHHNLCELDEVRLRSCLEEMRNVIGDSIPEHILIDSVLKNEFNFSKALDDVLNSAASATGQPEADAPKPQRERKSRDRGKRHFQSKFRADSPRLEDCSLSMAANYRRNLQKSWRTYAARRAPETRAGFDTEGHVQIPAEVRRGHGAGRMGPD